MFTEDRHAARIVADAAAAKRLGVTIAVRAAIVMLATAPGNALCQAAGVATLRDSAGVRIVVMRGDPFATDRRLATSAAKATTVVGLLSTDAHVFREIASAVLLKGGVLAVPDTRRGEVRLFDPAGRHIATAGRKGSGPGEFQSLAWIRRLTDTTIVAYDRARRAVVIDWHGTVLGTHMVAGPVVGQFASGGILVSRTLPGSLEKGLRVNRDSSEYYRYRAAPRWQDVDTLVRLPNSDKPLPLRLGTWAVTAKLPFGRATSAAVSGNEWFYSGDAGLELRVMSPQGRLLRIIRTEVRPAPVTADDWRAAGARLVATLDATARARAQQDYDRAERPPLRPQAGRLLVDDLGRIWLQKFEVDDSVAERWIVITASGELLGRVDVPPGRRLLDARSDRFVAVGKDADAVEHVTVWELKR